MKETNVYKYYCFGYNYNNLQTRLGIKPCGKVLEDLENKYLYYINDLYLPVTAKIVEPLSEIIIELKQIDEKLNITSGVPSV